LKFTNELTFCLIVNIFV